jgi:hypothetical protein
MLDITCNIQIFEWFWCDILWNLKGICVQKLNIKRPMSKSSFLYRYLRAVLIWWHTVVPLNTNFLYFHFFWFSLFLSWTVWGPCAPSHNCSWWPRTLKQDDQVGHRCGQHGSQDGLVDHEVASPSEWSRLFHPPQGQSQNNNLPDEIESRYIFSLENILNTVIIIPWDLIQYGGAKKSSSMNIGWARSMSKAVLKCLLPTLLNFLFLCQLNEKNFFL